MVYYVHFLGRMRDRDQIRCNDGIDEAYSRAEMLMRIGAIPNTDFKILETEPGSDVNGHFENVTEIVTAYLSELITSDGVSCHSQI